MCALCESDGRDKNEAAAVFAFCARVVAAVLQAAATAATAAQAGRSQGGENGRVCISRFGDYKADAFVCRPKSTRIRIWQSTHIWEFHMLSLHSDDLDFL